VRLYYAIDHQTLIFRRSGFRWGYFVVDFTTYRYCHAQNSFKKYILNRTEQNI